MPFAIWLSGRKAANKLMMIDDDSALKRVTIKQLRGIMHLLGDGGK